MQEQENRKWRVKLMELKDIVRKPLEALLSALATTLIVFLTRNLLYAIPIFVIGMRIIMWYWWIKFIVLFIKLLVKGVDGQQ